MARRDGGKQTRAGRSSCRRLPAAAAATAASLGMSSFSSKTRRRRTARWKGGRAVIAAGFLLWTGGASAQFTDGGDISMSCGDCDCSGSSDAGTVTVFENPSSGGKVRRKRVHFVVGLASWRERQRGAPKHTYAPTEALLCRSVNCVD